MKRLFLSLGILIVSLHLYAQQAPQAQKKVEDVVKFKEMSFDFGKIKQGTPVKHDFEFVNIGDGPVVIESAIASCGCTTPVKPEAPINKGALNRISAGFNAAAAGPFNKTITVKLAGIDMPTILRITGQVLNEADYAKYQQEQSAKPDKSGQ
jgi:hypothetical protein